MSVAPVPPLSPITLNASTLSDPPPKAPAFIALLSVSVGPLMIAVTFLITTSADSVGGASMRSPVPSAPPDR